MASSTMKALSSSGEHYTDTGGATEHVFGLCHLLGFRFAPRLRDLADRRLYVADGHVLTTAPSIP